MRSILFATASAKVSTAFAQHASAGPRPPTGPLSQVVRYVPAMAPYPRIREQHIALFGESGSGKTVLASSFYGPLQEKTYLNDLWNLVADDTGQGNRLLQNYLKMKEDGAPPLPNRFGGDTYYFSL